MAIITEKIKRTVDFDYEYINERKGQDNIYIHYDVKFHNTDELGETISISEYVDMGKTDIFSFPAKMFKEISDFLIDQGLLVVKEDLNVPTKRKQKTNYGSLPVPSVEREGKRDVEVEDRQEKEIFQSFASVESEEVAVEPDEILPPQIDENEDVEISVANVQEDLDEKEVEEMWKTRKENVTSNPEKVIKRKPAKEEIEEI